MDRSARRVTIWSVASVLIVLLAVATTAFSLWRGTVESDRDQTVAAVQSNATGTDVRVTGFGDPFGFQVEVLGGTGETVQVNEVGVAEGLAIPERSHVLALSRPSGALLGLARVPAATDSQGRTAITISPQATADALVALAPGVLNARSATTDRRVNDVANTVEFETLIAEIARNSDLGVQNARLDVALANVLSRVPGTPQSDQTRCEPAEAIATGVCLAFSLDGSVVPRNGQNRWAVVFESASTEACALIAPTSAEGNRDIGQTCARVVDIVAPGPVPEGSGPMVEDQVAIASFLTALGEYALPFSTLTLGADSTSGESSKALMSVPATASTFFASLNGPESGVADAAATLSAPDADDVARTGALLTLSRLALTAPELPTTLLDEPDFNPNAKSLALLNLYERSVANRTGGVGPPLWETPGWTRVDLAALVPGEAP